MPDARIMIVDDDSDVVEYLCSFLEDQGYETRSAIDSASAIELLEDYHPDAILIDVLMPGKSGLDLLVKIRSDERWRDLPVIIVTGSDKILEDDCQTYFGSHHGIRGPDGVLGKPVDRGTLLAVLSGVID